MTSSILQKISNFPISVHLNEICNNLMNSDSHILILTAETAAGKSTVLPLALLDQFDGKILMTEPRRLAVLGVANRLADLRDEAAGETVGYKIHLENRISKNTRLEVVTEGILVNQLQSDPALENYQVVVIDEFHERSVNTDLAIAFLKEAMELRDDLYVIIMSATINTEKLQSYFGGNELSVPVMSIPGRQFPVEISYKENWSVFQAVEEALRIQKDGNILVFLPGISDIRKNEEILKENLNDDVEICILHSSISLEEQKRVILEGPYTEVNSNSGVRRRIILSSAIAETSLTVPGVTCVIDSGLARVNRMNISTGMENLSTEVESEFSAEQRTGRAGRICAGKCIRLWSQFNPRIKDFPPEILRADITALVLECAERGVFTFDGIDWLDKPNSGAWAESSKLLKTLGFLKDDGHITEKGKTALKLGIHPRLSGIAIESYDGKKLSTEGAKLLIKYSSYSKVSEDLKHRFLSDLERRLSGINFEKSPEQDLILFGYPDRLAHRVTQIGKFPAEYQFASGRKALIYEGPAPEWIVAPEVMAGKVEGTIFEFEEISEQKVQNFIKIHAETRKKCEFVDGKVQKSEILCYGEIILSSKKLTVSPEDTAAAWVTEVQKKGFDSIPIDDKIEKFLLRVEFWNQQKGEPVDLCQKLVNEVEQWLPPFLGTSSKLTSQIIYDALYWYLEGSKIDSDVPEQLILPNGRRCKVKYEKQSEIKPIIEIIIQRIFGCFETPEICGKKVLLRLLSPASRPLQVTEDLEHFWTGAWVEICKEMKGRYPKHNWDYKVVEKE